MEKSISLYTTCKGRLAHLKETLLHNLHECKNLPVEFIVVDYCCPDGTGQWVKDNCIHEINQKIVKYYRYNKESDFHISHAKNIAASLCNNEIICNVDADCFISKELIHYISSIFSQKNSVFINMCDHNPNTKNKELCGLIACKKNDFLAINGYNEMFTGYGYDDIDFCNRLMDIGLQKIICNSDLAKTIHHQDRGKYYTNKEIHKSTELNKIIAHMPIQERQWGNSILVENFIKNITTSCGKKNILYL